MKNFKKFLPALAIATPLLAVAAFSSANGGFYASIANAGYGGQPTGGQYKQSFAAQINAPQEVPPTTSSATGSALFNLTMDEREIDYSVTLNNESDVTAANLYCAQPGSNGPEAVPLYNAGGSAAGSFSGTITQSDLLSSAQSCNPNITDVPQLAQAMREGSIYINVLTTSYPNGEIRGQLANTSTASNPGTGGGTGTTTPPTQPNYNPTISPTSETVSPGQHVDFGGRNFAPEETVNILVGSTTIGSAHADGGGNFSTGDLTMPTTPGTYTYNFMGTVSGVIVPSTITVQ
jgi:hypothetical protein